MKKLNNIGEYKKAINLYEDQIKKQNKQGSTLVLNQALKACVELREFKRGKDIHKNLSAAMANNTFIQTNLIRLYMKCGDYETSKQIFINSKNKTTPMFDNFLKGLADNNHCEEALNLVKNMTIQKSEYTYSILFKICAKIADQHSLEFGKLLFDKMPKKYLTDLVVITSALNMFIKCNDLQRAESLFHQINRIGKNLISYGSMMKLYNIKNQSEKTIELFQRMKMENFKPDEVIFVLVIDAISKIGDLSLALSLVDDIPENFLLYPQIQTGLIDLWGKIGLPEKSKQIFDTIQYPDNVTFAAMINAYGLNGMGSEAIELFNKVPSKMLDNAIYVCVLNACSHSALIDQAWKIFEQIPANQRTGQIYTTMVDATSRVFLFDQAEKLIDEYEQSHKPHIPMYMSVLSSCRNAKNILLSEKIFRRMEINFSNNENGLVAAQVLLANTYGLSGKKSMASNIQKKISQSNVKKTVGCSWTVSNGKIHNFHAHDRSHPNLSEIYQKLEEVKHQLTKFDYKADESWITRQLNDNETTESALFNHSERLAIAFNLIQQPIPSRIQIIKNLRICGDCHLFTKLVAKIYQCEIIVRDANRIHHFYPNGQCSCQDHF